CRRRTPTSTLFPYTTLFRSRVGQRNGLAAVRIACDMVAEKLIDRTEAIRRVKPEDLNQLLRPIFDPREKREATREGRLLTKGLNAGPGAATGRIVFNPDEAEASAARGEPVILVRIEKIGRAHV